VTAKKIDDLTPEQEARLDSFAEEYEASALSGDDSYDVEAIASGVDFIYGLAELAPPQIVICSSPADMCDQAELKEGETFDYLGSGYDSGWTAFFDFMQAVVGVEFDPEWGFDAWRRFVRESGVFATLLHENVAFVCVRPCAVHRTAEGDLHCEDGPAIEWCDGYGQFYLHGVGVDEALVMTPAGEIDPARLLKEENAEVRREIVRKVGIDTIVAKLGGKSIDKDGGYELLLLELGDGRRRPYLKMLNPSIGTWHVEGVDPSCQTVAAALTWRNGVAERPAVLT
jgi:hypothetical protein